MRNTSNFIKNFIENKISTHTTEKNYFIEQILVLDNSREDYKDALYKIDSNYFPDIQEVNDKILDVKNAYDARISSGCKSDLFWRKVGIGSDFDVDTGGYFFYDIYVCEQASPIGFGTNLLTYISGPGISESSTSNNLIGLEPDSLYGIRIYDEPYSGDVIDSYVGSFIGTIGIGSTILTVMAPQLTTQVSESLKIGQLIVDDTSDVFSLGQENEIVGLGTTSISLVSVGYTSTPTNVDQITLKYPAIRTVDSPESNLTFTSFTVLKDPDVIVNVGLPFASNPYIPQTIKMMKNSTLGTGTQIEFDDASGYPDASSSWNKFMEGFVDPAYVGNYNPNNIVVKPQVGAGKVYYRIGFDYRPMLNGSPASVGDTGTNETGGLYPVSQCTAELLPTCSGAIENAITNAISIRDEYETNLLNSNSEIQQKIQLSNTIRDELSEIDLRIWSYRCHIGKASENLDLTGQRLTELNSNDFKDLIDS